MYKHGSCAAFAILFLCSASLFSQQNETAEAPPNQIITPPPSSTRQGTLLELKGGYFTFASAKMRDVYYAGGVDVQLSGTSPIWKWMSIYGSVEYLQRHGLSRNAHEKTHIWAAPLSLGLKQTAPLASAVEFYFTIGPRYFFVQTHNYSNYVSKHINQNGIGGFTAIGFQFYPLQHLLIDLFGEYSYVRLNFHSSKENSFGRTMQCGGFTAGGGIGYAF